MRVAIRPKGRIKKFLITLIILTLLSGFLGLAAWIYFQRWLHSPLDLPQEGYVYDLQPGRTLGHLVQDLARRGYMKQPRWLTLYARTKDTSRIHAGEYLLVPGLTPHGLLEKLQRGEVIVYQITLVEGWTFQQALAALHAQDTLVPSLRNQSLEQQLQLLSLPIEHPEGWFFPDTYSYTRGTSDVEILRRAYNRMKQTLESLWSERAEDLPYETPYEALIMASIIERETGAPWEREKIAGVFVRRLGLGMRLQTDPTVIYGMGIAFQGKITRKDLQTPTVYNTYLISGLPPTPIALPGREAIRAALNPAREKNLYFVAKGDGTTHFSETLEEHNRAVRRYQLRRRTDYRSTVTPPAPSPAN